MRYQVWYTTVGSTTQTDGEYKLNCSTETDLLPIAEAAFQEWANRLGVGLSVLLIENGKPVRIRAGKK